MNLISKMFPSILRKVRQKFVPKSLFRASDPVFTEDGKWWFYDETWADAYGPYKTKRKARAALKRYVKCYL